MKIGFIGLGVMGTPMARHLLVAGHELYAHTRSGVPAELLGQGAKPCSSGKEVAEHADVVITMLPDTPDVELVLFGPNGVAEGLKPGATVIDMSSISPLETKRFAQRIELLGADYLDAPVSGGELGAKSASLTIMVGGPEHSFLKSKPLFELMGKNITHLGDNGAGQICKVANQMIVAITIEAISEALVFASKAGADPVKVRQALMGGFAGSRVLEVHGQRMLDRKFEPGFRIALHMKDLSLALDGAKELAVALPVTAICQQLFGSCVAQGGAAWDHSGLLQALERLANHKLVDQ